MLCNSNISQIAGYGKSLEPLFGPIRRPAALFVPSRCLLPGCGDHPDAVDLSHILRRKQSSSENNMSYIAFLRRNRATHSPMPCSNTEIPQKNVKRNSESLILNSMHSNFCASFNGRHLAATPKSNGLREWNVCEICREPTASLSLQS